jgi:hypothetical protein
MPRTLTPRFLGAAFISIVAHTALISGGWLQAPAIKVDKSVPLEARLVRLAPASPPPVAQPTSQPRPDARLAKPTRRPRPVRVPDIPPVATVPPHSSYEMPLPVGDDHVESPTPEAALAQPAAPAAAPSQTDATPQRPEAAPVKTLPRKGRITYTMYFGEDRFAVGKTVQTWEVDTDGYRLGSVSETTGIVDVFGAQRHIYLSEGRFTAHGLQPEKFFMSRTRRGRTEAARALFDWEAHTLTLGRVPQRRDAALLAEAQDIVSFMYQLALFPPETGRIRLPVTNGSRFETYDLDVLDEERIETPLGMLRALPVRQVPRPGAESIALWLAVDYRHLPVKIRFFDREGRPTGEQVVDQIEVSEE